MKVRKSVPLDPILMSVIARRLKGIGEQMGYALMRTAHSPLLVEGRDFSLGLYDASGCLIEQTEYIPVLGYATAPAVKYMARYFAGDLHPGDVILHNDPYTGGNQLSDVKVAKPVFFDGTHVAWTVINAHQADVGGGVAGAYNPLATEVWQEALRITPVKVFEKGKVRRDVWDLIFGNIRLSVVPKDIQAMIGGCTVGERELLALYEKYGLTTISAYVQGLLDSTEQMVRREIRSIRDGIYRAETYANYDGFHEGSRMKIAVTVTVGGEEMEIDFDGTDPQTVGYVNAPVAVTVSSVLIALYMCMDPHLPHNEAVLRPVTIKVPEGSFLNPRFPAASGFGNHLSDQICAVVMLALAEALPERVTAGWNPLLAGIVTGRSPRTQDTYVSILINACKGGGGATYSADGYDHIGLIASGGAIAADDPEMFEVQFPHYLEKYEYVADSAGAGRWRGGLGVETIFRFEADQIQASIFGDGAGPASAASGTLGGLSGAPNYLALEFPDGRVYQPKLKELISNIPSGTRWHQIAGGGGGYGNPHQRPAQRVAEEVRYGYVSVEAARDLYGVVLDTSTLALDEEATARLRRSH